MNRCQWKNAGMDRCKNRASRWFVRTQGDFLLVVCRKCVDEFLRLNGRGYREISRKEAKIWGVHNA